MTPREIVSAVAQSLIQNDYESADRIAENTIRKAEEAAATKALAAMFIEAGIKVDAQDEAEMAKVRKLAIEVLSNAARLGHAIRSNYGG